MRGSAPCRRTRAPSLRSRVDERRGTRGARAGLHGRQSPSVRRPGLRHSARGLDDAHRHQRLGQVDPAAHRRRPRAAHRRHGPLARRGTPSRRSRLAWRTRLPRPRQRLEGSAQHTREPGDAGLARWGAALAAGARRGAGTHGPTRQRRLPFTRLSAGQRRRLGLARLALSTRPLWLLDEPTTALDSDGQALFAGLLDEHLARGGCALVATHLGLPVRTAALPLRLGTTG
ncbi:MAG TPA: ATP-binding cassette domain-containing protein [Quisquiliibacterium sp.]|nr:ATP-binding cassette domain-containing protein [Quisquiliibacterium sp.]